MKKLIYRKWTMSLTDAFVQQLRIFAPGANLLKRMLMMLLFVSFGVATLSSNALAHETRKWDWCLKGDLISGSEREQLMRFEINNWQFSKVCEVYPEAILKKIRLERGDLLYLIVFPSRQIVLFYPSRTIYRSREIGLFSSESGTDSKWLMCSQKNGQDCGVSLAEIPGNTRETTSLFVQSPWGCKALHEEITKMEKSVASADANQPEIHRHWVNENTQCANGALGYVRRRSECSASGNGWQVNGPPGFLSRCWRILRDLGKACHDSRECEGRCVLPRNFTPTNGENPIIGECADVRLSCFTEVNNGKVGAHVCY